MPAAGSRGTTRCTAGAPWSRGSSAGTGQALVVLRLEQALHIFLEPFLERRAGRRRGAVSGGGGQGDGLESVIDVGEVGEVLSGQVGDAVGRERRGLGVLGRGEPLGLPIDRRGRGIDEPLAGVFLRRVEHVL